MIELVSWDSSSGNIGASFSTVVSKFTIETFWIFFVRFNLLHNEEPDDDNDNGDGDFADDDDRCQ